MSGILVAGAINTDFVATMARAPEAGETITASGFGEYAGGKAANQAVSAARNEAQVSIIGALGADAIGAARRADLEREGIDPTWVATDGDLSSGVALIFVEETGENRIAYVPGATSSVTVAWVEAAFDAIAPDLVLAPNELPPEALSALFARARAASVPVVYNVAPFSDASADLVHQADVVVLNQTELADLVRRCSVDPDDMLAALTGAGIGRGVVTLGADGAFVIEDGRVTAVAAPLVTVVDSTGAGDALCGALAAALARGDSLVEAARGGVHAGSLACTVMGAQPSSPIRAAIIASMRP